MAELLDRWHPVREALRARRRRLLRLRLGPRPPRGCEELEALARAAGVPVERQDADAFGRGLPPDARPQGLVLEVGPLPELHLEDLLQAQSAPCPCLVALDGVEDPQNLGAIARVAEASGVAGLLLTRRHAPPLTPAVSRASAGAIEHLPVARVPNLSRALEALARQGFWVLGADAHGKEDLHTSDDRVWTGPLVLVLGAEGRGLRAGTGRHVDHRIRIPMLGRVGSLNVAAAAALLCYERVRRTGGAGASAAPAEPRPRGGDGRKGGPSPREWAGLPLPPGGSIPIIRARPGSRLA